MIFEDRSSAGRALASSIDATEDMTILAIPRGGVTVAAAMAEALGVALDVFPVAKLRAPYQPELGLGAVGPEGVMVIDEDLVAEIGVEESYLGSEKADRLEKIQRQMDAYRGSRKFDMNGRLAVLVDDGVATGGTALAAIRALSRFEPREIWFAAPVISERAHERLLSAVDRVLCIEKPVRFMAVGHWYRHFPQVDDQEVIKTLGRFSR